MKRDSRRSLISLSLLFAGLALQLACAAENIPWSAERLLTWNDFLAPVAKGTEPENVAATAASLSWAYEYEIERTRNSCTYRLTDIRADAIFHPDDSWVRPDHRTADVLEHEQGHFDITQVYKLMFEATARGLVGTEGVCEGRSEKRISSFVRSEIARFVKPLYEQIWRDHTTVQDTYDAQTHHGLDAPAQARWLARIAAALRDGGISVPSLASPPATR